jgi:hypothetical protein
MSKYFYHRIHGVEVIFLASIGTSVIDYSITPQLPQQPNNLITQ